MKKYLTLLVLQFLVLGLTQVNASHVTGEAITLRRLPNGMSVFQIWMVRACDEIPLVDTPFQIKLLGGSTFPSIPCSLSSFRQLSPSCFFNNSTPNISLSCNSLNVLARAGSYLLVLFESQPVDLSQFTFTPNNWATFYFNGICCLGNYSNFNMPKANALLSLRTDGSGKVKAKSSLQIQEWPQTTFCRSDTSFLKWSVQFSGDGNDLWTWRHTVPKEVNANAIVNLSYRRLGVSTIQPFPGFSRNPNTDVVTLDSNSISNAKYLVYIEALHRENGELVSTLSFYSTIQIFNNCGVATFTQPVPLISNIPTPFDTNSTPVIYAIPGDSIAFPMSVTNKFAFNNLTSVARLIGDEASNCNKPPCAIINPLPGTTASNIVYQSLNSGQGMTFTGNDSSRLDFTFNWKPGFQHLDFDLLQNNYKSRLVPFAIHGMNMICPATISNYRSFFIHLFIPNAPIINVLSANLNSQNTASVLLQAHLDSTPTNANINNIDFQVYKDKQSKLKLHCYLESADAPFGAYQRCSSTKPMVFTSSTSTFDLQLTDSTLSGLSVLTKWYRLVSQVYLANTLVNTTTSQPFQALTNPGQLPVVQVKPDTVCVGVPTRLVAVSSNGAQNPTFQWRYNGVVQSSTTDVLDLPRLSVNDSVRVEMTSRNGVANLNTVSSTVVRPAKIQPLIPRITRQGDSLVSSIRMSNQWYDLSAGLLPNDTLYWIKPSAGNFGPYTVVNRQQYCMVNSIDTVSFFPVQVQELTEGVIKLYPQPASAILNIQLPENISAQTVEIMDIQGKVVQRLEKAAETNLLTLDTQPFSNGMYLIRTWIGGKEIRKKFLVQHP